MPKEWYRWLTLIHHAAAVLSLTSKDGPIEVLPDYSGVVFPFITEEIFDGKDLPLGSLRARWKTIRGEADAFTTWKDRYRMLRAVGKNRPVRGLWPYLGDNEEVTGKIMQIYNDLKSREIPIDGCQGYTFGYQSEPELALNMLSSWTSASAGSATDEFLVGIYSVTSCISASVRSRTHK